MWFDFLILGILLFFTVRGAMRGAVGQIAGIAGIVLCFIFADGISAVAGPYVHLEPPLNNWVILFVAYLVFTFFAFALAGRLHSLLDKAKMKDFDHHLGAVFGFLKGAVLSLLLTFMVVTVSDDARTALKDSKSGRAAAIVMDRLHPILPEKMHHALEKYIHKLDSPDLDLHYAEDEHDGQDHGLGTEHSGTNISLGNDTNLGNGSTIPGGATGSFWQDLQGLVSQQTQQAIANALTTETNSQTVEDIQFGLRHVFESATPQQRQQLENLFVQMGPEQLKTYLTNQFNLGSTENNSTIPSSPNQPPQSVVSLSDLATQIAQAYTSVPSQQSQYKEQIGQFLGTLPENVHRGVLEDWNADIWQSADPDPGTGPQSTLEQRILRQMQRFNVTISDLDPSMQQRLRAAQGQPSTSLK